MISSHSRAQPWLTIIAPYSRTCSITALPTPTNSPFPTAVASPSTTSYGSFMVALSQPIPEDLILYPQSNSLSASNAARRPSPPYIASSKTSQVTTYIRHSSWHPNSMTAPPLAGSSHKAGKRRLVPINHFYPLQSMITELGMHTGSGRQVMLRVSRLRGSGLYHWLRFRV